MRNCATSVAVIIVTVLVMRQSALGSESPAGGFAKRIQPILDANCVACHQSGSAQQGLILESGLAYQNLVGQKSKESSLDLIAPGNPDRSYLMQKLRGSQLSVGGSGAQMPLGGVLESADLEAIDAWIRLGARND
jgi:mono/diheme cytochrome c family protein